MRYLILISLTFIFSTGQAQTLKPGLSGLIEAGLERSSETKLASDEVNLQSELKSFAKVQKFTPQIDLSASYQKFKFSQPFIGTNGPESNDGNNPNISLSLTYDLQKVFGPESALASENLYYAKLQAKLAQRDLVRNIKKTYFAIKEIDQEKIELEKLIQLFDKTDAVLKRQRSLGLNNAVEIEQFNIQRNLLTSDLEGKKAEQEMLYLNLSNLTRIELATLKPHVNNSTDKINLQHTGSFPLDATNVDAMTDKTILESLSHDYNASQLEYEKYNSFPLPSVFIREQRQWPTFPSSDGPSTMDEVGVSIPLGDIFVRGQGKSQLKSKALKSEHLMEKNIFEYKTMIKGALQNVRQLKVQSALLKSTKEQSQKLLDKAFQLYSQKRIDSVGTLDIFQKYLQASRSLLNNDLQLQHADSDLEYLLGNQSL